MILFYVIGLEEKGLCFFSFDWFALALLLFLITTLNSSCALLGGRSCLAELVAASLVWS